MKKRILCLLLAAVLLAGCAPAVEETVPTVTEPELRTEGLPTVEPAVLYDRDGITLTAHEFGKLGEDYALSMILTNNTDQSVGVGSRSLSVNGCMMSASGLEISADSGKKELGYLLLDAGELQSAGIGTVAELEFSLQFFALGDDDLASTDLITFRTSAAGEAPPPIDDSGIEVYNEGGIRVVYKGYTVDENDDGYANFYLENNTDRRLEFTCDNAKVNGAPMDGTLWTEVRPGRAAIGGVCFFDLGTMGITSGEELVSLSLTLTAMDSDAMAEYLTLPEISLRFAD